MKLKQSDRRGFSVRSTGAVDTKGLPTRNYKSRSHLEQYSGSAIRFGEFESLNFSIGMPMEDLVLFHALYRTSIKGRSDLAKLLFKNLDDPDVLEGAIDKSYTSRVAEVFSVILKSMALGVDFIDEDEIITAINDQEMSAHLFENRVIMCTDYQFFLIQRANDIRKEILEENAVMVASVLEKKVEEELQKRNFLMGPLKEEVGAIYDLIKL